MERSPLLYLFTDLDPQPGSETRPVSQVGTDCFDFEFPAAISGSAIPNDVVFCGKVISRKTRPREKSKNPFLLLRSESSIGHKNRSESFSAGRSNRAAEPGRCASSGENRWRRSGSSGRKHRNGLFGMVKFPLQMELSDMKMRQERREQLRLSLPPLAADGHGCSMSGGGGESCWDRPLRRRSQLMNALARATFGCIPIT